MISIYVIYRHPRDYPGSYVLRRWKVRAGGPPTPDENPIAVAGTLNGARQEIPIGFYQMIGPEEGDDPVIQEVWL